MILKMGSFIFKPFLSEYIIYCMNIIYIGLNEKIYNRHVIFKGLMILIQQFLPVHFYGNPTDKNLAQNLSLDRFLCAGGLK